MNGRVPADDLADELAGDQHALQARLSQPVVAAPGPTLTPADDQRRIATALQNLEAPDALQTRAEAVRLAEDAARALADPQPGRDPNDAVKAAAEAADALAARLARPGQG